MPEKLFSPAGWQPASVMWRKSSVRLRAGSVQRPYIMCRKSSFRLRAGSPQRPYVPEKLFSSAGWQPARRDVAKEFVSSADWQPAETLCAGKALFVCGLAARTA